MHFLSPASVLLPRKQNPRTQHILALNPNVFSPESIDTLFSQEQEYAGYLPIASQFQIHPFYTLSAMLGVGFWKLYVPGFFAFPLVLPLDSSREARKAEGKRTRLPSYLLPNTGDFSCQQQLAQTSASSAFSTPRIGRLDPAEKSLR